MNRVSPPDDPLRSLTVLVPSSLFLWLKSMSQRERLSQGALVTQALEHLRQETDNGSAQTDRPAV